MRHICKQTSSETEANFTPQASTWIVYYYAFYCIQPLILNQNNGNGRYITDLEIKL